jgi:hypothetical protein
MLKFFSLLFKKHNGNVSQKSISKKLQFGIAVFFHLCFSLYERKENAVLERREEFRRKC